MIQLSPPGLPTLTPLARVCALVRQQLPLIPSAKQTAVPVPHGFSGQVNNGRGRCRATLLRPQTLWLCSREVLVVSGANSSREQSVRCPSRPRRWSHARAYPRPLQTSNNSREQSVRVAKESQRRPDGRAAGGFIVIWASPVRAGAYNLVLPAVWRWCREAQG